MACIRACDRAVGSSQTNLLRETSPDRLTTRDPPDYSRTANGSKIELLASLSKWHDGDRFQLEECSQHGESTYLYSSADGWRFGVHVFVPNLEKGLQIRHIGEVICDLHNVPKSGSSLV
jgi:hypothetical protein